MWIPFSEDVMAKILKIARALYEVDDDTKIYRCYCRNPDWKCLSTPETARNKKRIDGFTRIFPDGRKKVFRYEGKMSDPEFVNIQALQDMLRLG